MIRETAADRRIRRAMSAHADSLVRLEYFRHYVGTEHPCFLEEWRMERRRRADLAMEVADAGLDAVRISAFRRECLALLTMRAGARSCDREAWAEVSRRLLEADLSDVFPRVGRTVEGRAAVPSPAP